MKEDKVIRHTPVWYSEHRVIPILLGTFGIDSLREANRPENQRIHMREICMYVLDLYTCLHTKDYAILFNANLGTLQSGLCRFKKQLAEGNHPRANKMINQIMYAI